MSQGIDNNETGKAGDDGRRNEKTLKNRKTRPDDDPCYQKDTNGAKGHDSGHGKLSYARQFGTG